MTDAIAGLARDPVETVDVPIDADCLPDAVKARHTVRMPGLDANSQQDFVRGFKQWMSRKTQAAEPDHSRTFLNANGHDDGPTTLDYEACFDLLKTDPIYATRLRLNWAIQDIMWDRALRAFDLRRDEYLAAMAQTDERGPGSLELNPDMALPAYACHEIHRQPGGFVGNDFAGWLYHYCLSLAYYQGHSDHDEVFFRNAQSQPLPRDGPVRRILDVGCGAGLLTTAFKQRFPNAECWGIDVGAPMVRYAHHRAVTMGFDVHYAQRLGEDNRFPNDHFDIVTTYIAFHEMNVEAIQGVIREIFRVLRPGGVFGHLDGPTAGHPTHTPPDTISGKAGLWNVYRHNYEPWYLDYAEFDLPRALEGAGFELDLSGGPVLWNGRPRVVAYKPL